MIRNKEIKKRWLHVAVIYKWVLRSDLKGDIDSAVLSHQAAHPKAQSGPDGKSMVTFRCVPQL